MNTLLLPLGRKKLMIKEHELPLIVVSAAHIVNIKTIARKTLPPSFVTS